MKPAPFEYLAPRSLDEALELMEEHGWDAKLMAGGQSLVPMMSFRLARPTLVVDLNGVTELDHLSLAGDGSLRFGAMVRQRRLERDERVARVAPLLAETAPFIAHPQIRNRGTVGGSLAHADPAAELPAVALALRARLRLARRGGERWVSAQEFYVGLLTTALEPEEVLVEVAVPALPARTGWAFRELARRHGDYAQAGVAAVLRLDDAGRCAEARMVYLSVGEVPLEARGAAALLVGEEPTPAALAAAAEHAAREEIDPTGDIHATADYKRHLARVLTVRALTTAAERAGRMS